MEELRLSWRALRCELGPGAVLVGRAPTSQIRAAQAARAAEAVDWGIPPRTGGGPGLCCFRVRTCRWVGTEPGGGPGSIAGARPGVMSVVIHGPAADRALEVLAKTPEQASETFVAALNLVEADERRLASALASAGPLGPEQAARVAIMLAEGRIGS